MYDLVIRIFITKNTGTGTHYVFDSNYMISNDNEKFVERKAYIKIVCAPCVKSTNTICFPGILLFSRQPVHRKKYAVRADNIAGTNLHISTKLVLPVHGKKVETGFLMFLLLTYSNQSKRILIEIFLFNESTMAMGTNRSKSQQQTYFDSEISTYFENDNFH